MTNRRQFLGAGLRLATAAGCGVLAAPTWAASKKVAIRTTELAPGVSLLSGAGCNVLALRGPQGSLLVDGGYAAEARAVLKAATSATKNRKVATLINTHWHPAQTGANEAVGRDGGTLIAHEVTARYLARPIASVDYEGLYGPLPRAALPTSTTRTNGELEFGGQMVQYGYLPAAHTNGDLYVFLPEANVLVAGGPVQSQSWPLLDYRNGAWLGGLVRGQEKLAGLVRDDTRVIPANGRLMTGAELKQQSGMIAAFHEQLVVFQNRGYDSGDCIAQRPLKDFEAQYGDAKDFIYGAFQSLNIAYSPD